MYFSFLESNAYKVITTNQFYYLVKISNPLLRYYIIEHFVIKFISSEESFFNIKNDSLETKQLHFIISITFELIKENILFCFITLYN